MREMIITLKEAFQENPKDFIRSIILFAAMSLILFISFIVGN